MEPGASGILSGKEVGSHLQIRDQETVLCQDSEPAVYDDIVIITDEALKTAKDLAAKGGAHAASQEARMWRQRSGRRKTQKGKTIVTILPDTAEHYFPPLFDEQ